MTSTPSLLLDTHIWMDFINASPKLRTPTVTAIDAARLTGSAFVSIISIWEIALLARLKRISLQVSVSRWVEEAFQLPGIQLLPLTPEIAIASVDLPEPLPTDPSDRILVASARVERLTLVTRDRDILTFAKSNKLACLQA